MSALNKELANDWLVGQLRTRLVHGDAIATAAALGSIIADCQQVIDLVQMEMDKPNEVEPLELRVVCGVIAMCNPDEVRINPL